MPLLNALPIAAFPGNPWSATAPQQALELITQWNMDEIDALNQAPEPDLRWVERGSMTAVGTGIVKIGSRMPQSLAFSEFKSGNRHYNTLDIVATQIKVAPYDLNFKIPMIWDHIGNGWKLMSQAPDGSLMEFVGLAGLAKDFVTAGRAYKAQLAASLFYSGVYCTGLNITPTALTFPQGLSTSGIALFTDGTGGDGTFGAQHYSNPTVNGSGRFKNVWTGFGTFASNFGASITKMALKPHATLPNTTSGARVTDVFGPSHMRDKFWRMMIQTLSPELFASAPALAAAASTNPYSALAAAGITEDNFLGSGFGTRRYWILPQLDNHPYVLNTTTAGADGGPADFWINVSAGPQRPTWCKLAGNSKEFVPTFRFYGAGDPLAQNERMCRFESDLDGGVSAGAYGEVDMFMETVPAII